ncbi:MAG: NAD-dependent epimerase/dehydratase family protein [Bacteroidetes bacterium]|nr:NAD-dependent epimerase/dehydratase family protein [Bacteroidota bacterium]
MKNILLLGATGFVGQNVADVLKLNSTFNLIESSRSLGTDLIQYNDVVLLFKNSKPDYIINCAAHVGSLNYVTQMAASVMLDNSRMLLNIYQALSEVCPTAIIINPIANCAYPANADTFSEDNWMSGHLHRSVLSYGATKRLLWHIGESFFMQHQIKSIYLFVPNMYGPKDSTDPNKAHALNALICRFVKAEREEKKEIELWGTGIAIREWLYAEDFAKILELILTQKVTIGLDEPLNIGQNFGLSVRELSNIINQKFNNKFKVTWDHSMPDGAPKKVMDERRFKKIFPAFEFTSFEIGIQATTNYYKSIYPY